MLRTNTVAKVTGRYFWGLFPIKKFMTSGKWLLRCCSRKALVLMLLKHTKRHIKTANAVVIKFSLYVVLYNIPIVSKWSCSLQPSISTVHLIGWKGVHFYENWYGLGLVCMLFVCCLANLYSVSSPDSVEYLGFAWEIDSRLRYFEG